MRVKFENGMLKMARNLLSVSTLVARGAKVCFHEPLNVLCPDGTNFPFLRHGGLFLFDGFQVSEAHSVSQNVD